MYLWDFTQFSTNCLITSETSEVNSLKFCRSIAILYFSSCGLNAFQNHSAKPMPISVCILMRQPHEQQQCH